MTNRPSINSTNSRDRVARRAGCVFGRCRRSGEKTGKNVESAPLPPPTARRRDGVAASATRFRRLYDTHIHPVNAAALVGAFSPRSPCTICPLCLPSGTHFDGGSAEAYQNTMPLPRLPGCTKCRSDDSDALWGRRSRSRRRTQGWCALLSAGAYVGARKMSINRVGEDEGSACQPPIKSDRSRFNPNG